MLGCSNKEWQEVFYSIWFYKTKLRVWCKNNLLTKITTSHGIAYFWN